MTTEDSGNSYTNEERRRNWDLVIADHQKMEDFMASTKDYRDRQEKAIMELTHSVSALSISIISVNKRLDDMTKAYKTFMWGVTAVVGTSLVALVNWGFEFIKAHFR